VSPASRDESPGRDFHFSQCIGANRDQGYAYYHCRGRCRATNISKAKLEELFVDELILAFAERVLPSASNLWVQSSQNQKQRLQQLFFPGGVRFDGKRLVGTGTTLPVFNYLSPVSESKNEAVDQTGIEPVTS
jgi:hypothetical protein